MRLLAIHGIGYGNKNKEKAVDLWRIKRPIDELKKHVDWEIVEQPTLIEGIENYKDGREFTDAELEKATKHLGTFDIIWATYFSNPMFYALLKVVQARYGTKFVMDVDDDLFAIKHDNPVWMKLTDENVYHMQCMVRDADYITTTTHEFAETLRTKRPDKDKGSVYVVPNMIHAGYKHNPIDNGDELVIGYFGGSSHIMDLETTGVIPAVEKIMHENRNIRFVSCGIPIIKYLPKGRYTYDEGMPSTDWVDVVFPRLNFDIALGPIEESIFSNGKSNIKWQEATRMGAAFIASSTGPYKTLADGVHALLVKNTEEDWYGAIKKLVDKPKLRGILVENARKKLKECELETQWPVIKHVFESINKGAPSEPHTTIKQSIIL